MTMTRAFTTCQPTRYDLVRIYKEIVLGYATIRCAQAFNKLGNHSFPATGIAAHSKNGGTLERAAVMANHASTRTTQLHDRR